MPTKTPPKPQFPEALKELRTIFTRQAMLLAQLEAQITQITLLVDEGLKSPYHHYETVREINKILKGDIQ